MATLAPGMVNTTGGIEFSITGQPVAPGMAAPVPGITTGSAMGGAGYRGRRNGADMYMGSGLTQAAAGTVKETDNGVSFFGVTNLQTGTCSIRAEWVYSLQDKVTEEELAEIVNTIEHVFSVPNVYIKKTYNIQRGVFVAFLPTFGLSMILVGLPSGIIRGSKYQKLVQAAYDNANEICRNLNKNLLKERGVRVSLRQHGMQGSYHLPELHFDFDPKRTSLPPANVVDDNIPVAELAVDQK